jgi:hypothetical protein
LTMCTGAPPPAHFTHIVQQAVRVHIKVVHLNLLQGHIRLLVVLIEPGVEAWDSHTAAAGGVWRGVLLCPL